MAPTLEEQEKLFEEQLGQMRVDYLICHGVAHKWEIATLEVEFGHFQLGLICERCGMERDRVTDMTGQRRNRYWHPEGNYYFRGTGRRSKERLAVINDTWQSEMRGKLPRKRTTAEVHPLFGEEPASATTGSRQA